MILLLACLLAASPAGAAYDEEGLASAFASTRTADNSWEETAPPLAPESDEDLAALVHDYIRRDILLKGAFLLEEKPGGKVLKLTLAAVDAAARPGRNGARTVTAVFKEAGGKKRTAVFHLRPGAWGGTDIFRIELKETPASPGKGN